MILKKTLTFTVKRGHFNSLIDPNPLGVQSMYLFIAYKYLLKFMNILSKVTTYQNL